MKLKDKVVVVTGASDGIGKEISLKLAREGVKLALVARDEKRLKQVKAKSKKLRSPKAEYYPCDLRDNEQVKEAVKRIISDFKSADILINNAGIWQKLSSLEKISESDVEDVLGTNLTAMVQITRLLIPHLKKQKETAIINISSRSGFRAQEGQSVYSASKWGVRGFTEVLKEDLKKTNIRVAGVNQGGVDTGMFRKAGDIFDQSHLMKPADLADVIVFMLTRPKKIWLHDVRVES